MFLCDIVGVPVFECMRLCLCVSVCVCMCAYAF